EDLIGLHQREWHISERRRKELESYLRNGTRPRNVVFTSARLLRRANERNHRSHAVHLRLQSLSLVAGSARRNRPYAAAVLEIPAEFHTRKSISDNMLWDWQSDRLPGGQRELLHSLHSQPGVPATASRR